MPRISIDNYDTVASWNGSQDLFVVEQPDGTKVATPAMVKQFIEAGDFEATGEVKDGHGNILSDIAELKQISGTGDYGCEYTAYKYGRIVFLRISNITASAGQGMTLFVLPQGYRPKITADSVGSDAESNFDTTAHGVNFRAETNGRVWTYSYRAFTRGLCCFTYISEE